MQATCLSSHSVQIIGKYQITSGRSLFSNQRPAAFQL
ncbi:Uncharacterised protein [Segatella copri]|nr:Uncharacterised protein [Segatella copri]